MVMLLSVVDLWSTRTPAPGGYSRGSLAGAARVGGELGSSTRGGGVARLLRRGSRRPGTGSSSPAPAAAAESDAFICYSRRDREFVVRLHAALAAAGKDVYVDWEDIPNWSPD